MTKKFNIGFTLALASALGFSSMAIFAKIVYAQNVNVTTILAFRFIIAAILLWIYIFLTGTSLRVEKRDLPMIILLGALGYGSMSTCFFIGLQYISASMVAMLLYTYPSFVTILAFFMLKESFNKIKVTALILSILGIVIMLWSPEGVRLNIVGVSFALASGIIYSLYIVLAGKISKKVDTTVFSAYIITGAAVSFFIYGLSTDNLVFNLSPSSWFAISLIAVFSTVVAIVTFFAAVNKIGASKASIVSTFEPLFTTILAISFLGEKLTFLQVIGGVLILTSVVLLHKREENQEILQKMGKEIPSSNI